MLASCHRQLQQQDLSCAWARAGAVAVSSAAMTDMLELTDGNVELVLDEIRPYLMAGLRPQHSCMHACTPPSLVHC